ncbi:MAG: hypothetical protein ACRD3J_15055, partial [Thermoanaerobaculia bacterium]
CVLILYLHKEQEAARRCIVTEMLADLFSVAAVQHRLRFVRNSCFRHRCVWIFLVLFPRLWVIGKLVDEIRRVLV